MHILAIYRELHLNSGNAESTLLPRDSTSIAVKFPSLAYRDRGSFREANGGLIIERVSLPRSRGMPVIIMRCQ